MIDFIETTLDNGLRIIVHQDHQTPLAVVNLMYLVGARNENEERTGFAHLFEHLMFGGSLNVPEFDKSMQRVGAENNAFTNNDFTNYHITLPAQNIDTALWAESDRMLNLNLNQEVLEIQKKVVIEEYKQRYLNQPYGDTWHLLRSMAYKVHPYKWPTIGQNISHIENASLDDVKDFFDSYYNPDNAIITICGDVDTDDIIKKIEHWFGGIPSGNFKKKPIPLEPAQKESQFFETTANVPLNAIYKVYHMPGRNTRDYYAIDLISDLLGRGKSSRLYKVLLKEKKIFNTISASINGSFDPGLLIIAGRINPDIDIDDANKAIDKEIENLIAKVDEEELEKVKNQAEASIYFSKSELLNRALSLSIGNALGNTNLINEEIELLKAVTLKEIAANAIRIFEEKNSCTLFYKKNTD